MSTITVAELALRQRGGFDFTLLDVRRAQARAADGTDIAGARWLDPALWLDWKDTIGNARLVARFIDPDDRAMLAHGMVLYDALYAWCQAYRAGAPG